MQVQSDQQSVKSNRCDWHQIRRDRGLLTKASAYERFLPLLHLRTYRFQITAPMDTHFGHQVPTVAERQFLPLSNRVGAATNCEPPCVSPVDRSIHFPAGPSAVNRRHQLGRNDNELASGLRRDIYYITSFTRVILRRGFQASRFVA